ncbi:predicted protein [Sclerotinia sclerotiorum 1980 UF-70]|uniref:Uncharacterized protein n=2 Tax=Sclerotinia sclerotiorum (strain ATCC 18683 / 1980 / Ss-1) TaxID=665079 RepID=A7EQC0_SCLS1|nr:predicted protein [Sclerotinia sclerotiorum 1980 UF-70]APA10099.1 hypothetical protein sscle_06g048690 [Sclerotinia sclerotiorum 1980 UF-70]EDO05036.1 predicted protein [Sclerotinia sclerotiorum 1980 UF-70]
MRRIWNRRGKKEEETKNRNLRVNISLDWARLDLGVGLLHCDRIPGVDGELI